MIILTLSSVLALNGAVTTGFAVEASTAQDPDPSAQDAEGQDEGGGGTPTPSSEDRTDTVRGLYLGAGVGLTHSLSGSRGDEIKLVELEGGDLFAQIERSEDTDIRVLFETHYLFEDQSILMGWRERLDEDGNALPSTGHWIEAYFTALGAFAACGPFALVDAAGDLGRRGCGPFFAAAIETDASVSEFGLGWMVAFGQNGNALDGFGFGIGVMFDPDSNLLDSRVIDPETMLVRDEFASAARAGEVSLTTQETSTSLMLMVSRSF